MLRKKNYKEEEHFTDLHTFTIIASPNPDTPPKKFQVYYKRYRPAASGAVNVYSLLTKKDQSQEEKQQITEYPVDRTLELISFDGGLGFVKKYLRKVGKIRKFEVGEGLYKGSKISTAIVVFKFEFDLVKCFRDDYLQTCIDEQCLHSNKQMTEEDREQQRVDLIQKHMGKQLSEKVEKLQKMQEGGFQVVTDIFGQYRMNYQSNQKFVQNLPQLKKKKKEEQKKRRLREQRKNESLIKKEEENLEDIM